MANYSYNDIAEAVNLTLREGGSPKSVVEFLSRKKLLGKSDDILSRLEELVNDEKGILKGKIWTVDQLGTKERNEIISHLEKKYEGKKIELEEHTDHRLKGGWKIEIGGEMIDLSLKRKLKKLEEHLTRNI